MAGKYSEERVEIVLESLRNGAPRKYAAEAAGVSASTLADWMDRVEGLRAKVEQARKRRSPAKQREEVAQAVAAQVRMPLQAL